MTSVVPRRSARASIKRQAVPQTIEGSALAVQARMVELMNAGDFVSARAMRKVGSHWAVDVVAFTSPPKPAKTGHRAVWIAAGVGISAVVVAVVMVVSWVLAHLAQIVTGAVLVLVAWFLLTRLNHSGACPGLHCSGCKGGH